MLEICPKCKGKAVHYEAQPYYERNVCALCGWMHTPKSYWQAAHYQIHGNNNDTGVGLPIEEYRESRSMSVTDEIAAMPMFYMASSIRNGHAFDHIFNEVNIRAMTYEKKA
jgi:hypothetical protein